MKDKKEGWGRIVLSPSRFVRKNIEHYFIRNQTGTLCGHYAIQLELKYKVKIVTEVKNQCKACLIAIPYWEKHAEREFETRDRTQDEYFAQFDQPEKITVTSKTFIVGPDVRCNHVDKNGKRCPNTGGYLTSDPKAAKENDHPCLKHNLRVKLFLSQSKKEVLA